MKNVTVLLALVAVAAMRVPAGAAPLPIRYAFEGMGEGNIINFRWALGSGTDLCGLYWSVSGLFMDVTEPMLVTEVGGVVFNTPGGGSGNCGPMGIQVFSGVDAYLAAPPGHGDVVDTAIDHYSGWEDIGLVNWHGNPMYYVKSNVIRPFTIAPGRYVVTLPVKSTSPWFNWAETGIDLGSDIYSRWSFGTLEMWTYYGDWPQYYTTGTAAVNIWGVPIGGPSIVFRQKEGDTSSFWGPLEDEVPGWDHVGLYLGGRVYETHPDQEGTWWDADAERYVWFDAPDSGVQYRHLKGSFKHYSRTEESDAAVEEVFIPPDLADDMAAQIETVMAGGFRAVRYGIDDYLIRMTPSRQKGEGGDYSCVGLLEWAAEQTGLNGGEGLIPDAMESVTVPGRAGP